MTDTFTLGVSDHGKPSQVRSVTMGEDVGHWNVFHVDPADDCRNTPWEKLSPEAQDWLLGREP